VGLWLVNVAAAIAIDNGVVERSRIGGISDVPRSLTVVEDVMQEKPAKEATARLAGQAAIRRARPLDYNQFRIPLSANLVTRAVRAAA
jgi:CO/xanthine dehydrogenase FAD-binding subunit